MMPEHDTKSVEFSKIYSQKKPLAETDKDPLKYTPSKRIFFRENFQKHETAVVRKDVSCFKSNSKILKKKRHKDKFKLFKLDRHLWDPMTQIPQLGKSAKYLKKKDKLTAYGQMSGDGKDKVSCVGRTNQIGSYYRPKPLEYTFDVLCLTDSDSIHPLVKEPEGKKELFGSDLLTMRSSFQDAMPVPNAGATNEIFVGDLIDLGTPKTFKSKVDHYDSQLSALAMDKISEPDQDSCFNLLSNVNLSLVNPMEPGGLDAQAYMQPSIISEVKILGSGESEDQPAGSSLVMHDHSNPTCKNSAVGLDDQFQSSLSELSQFLNNSNGLDERVSSPLVFYGFPGLNSPTGEKHQIWTSHPCQILVDHLNKNPFPKVVRENAKVQVRRRAFSMDDTLLVALPCIRRLEEIVGPRPPFVDDAEAILNEETPCPQHSELHSLNEDSSEPIEEHSTLMEDESDSANHPYREKRCSNSNIILSNDLSQYSKDSTLESNTDSAIDSDKSYKRSSHVLPAADSWSITEWESGTIVLSELSNVNIGNETPIEKSVESPLIGEECTGVPGNNEGSSEASDNISSAKDQLNLLSSESTHIDQQCEGPEETNPSKSAVKVIEELSDGEISSTHQHVTRNLGITMQNRSLEFEQKLVIDAIVNTSEIGLIVNRQVPGSDSREILTQNMFEQTPTTSSYSEIELSERLASNAQIPLFIYPSKLVVVDNIDDMPEHLDSNLDSTLINLQAVGPETSITMGAGLSLPTKFNNNTEKPNLERNLEQCSSHSLADVSAGEVDKNTETKKCDENIAEACSKHTQEMASPTDAEFEDSDNDSIFADQSCMTPLEHWVLPPGKKYRRSLSIIRNLDEHSSAAGRRGRHYEKSVEEIIRLQGNNVEARTPVQSLRKRLSIRRSSRMRQITPPPVRRNTFIWSPTVPKRETLFETPHPRKSIYSTPMQQNLVHRLSVRASPMLEPRFSMRSPLNRDCTPASPVQYTIRDLILTICKQTEPCSFSDILNEDSYEGGCKLGEGVFGEVFSINREGQNTVLKIIPIEGQQLVNGEKQKNYEEVLSELVIAKVLDELRYEGLDESNQTSGYAQLIATSLVQGSYPETLLQFWEEFDQAKGSDNENPKLFHEEQLFIVMEQGNGGKDLESYTFSSAKQSLSVLKQIAFSLAVAEISVEFEHRDLHWGNVLVSKTSEKQIFYTLNGTQYSVASNGVKCTIIDYTLSRIKYINQVPIYNDIGKDPEMFIATGDYQFDIYRFMKKDVEDDWSRFAPKTNARWLHYLLDKMLTKVKYQRKTAKVHKDSFKALEEIGTWVEDCGSALSIALRLIESKH